MSGSVEKDVREFILENFLFGDESRMPEMTESLLEADLINSTGILELVAYLEQHFGLAIADAEIIPANLEFDRQHLRLRDLEEQDRAAHGKRRGIGRRQ